MAATLADDDATTRHLVVEKVFSFAESGDYIALHALLDEFEPRISNLANATDVDGDTPLIVASLNGALTAVNVLLARGARVNAIGCSGRTALHCAAFFGHVDTVNRLLQCDATLVAVQDTIDEIPLHKAATNGHLGVVQSLLLAMRKRRATNAIRGPPNDDAGDEIDNFVFEQLLDLPNFLGSTPLHNATQHAHLNVMEVSNN
jgi:ankyrin repeat protein